MKLFLENTIRSRGIERAVQALEDYAPAGVEFTTASEADVVVIQVNGRLQHLKKKIAAYNKPYVIVQHAWRSTMNPDPQDWMEVWKDAVLVWSHYDLPIVHNFFRSPFGVTKEFIHPTAKKDILVCTTGLSYLTEGVRECIIAAQALGDVLHLGPDVGRGFPHVTCVSGITDKALAGLYARCKYVCGLRRVEGFEIPCAEGILCGARPILFDQPHYRDWFDGIAEFVPERPRDEVLTSLNILFRQPYHPVTNDEKKYAQNLFNWDTIIQDFYGHLADNLQ